MARASGRTAGCSPGGHFAAIELIEHRVDYRSPSAAVIPKVDEQLVGFTLFHLFEQFAEFLGKHRYLSESFFYGGGTLLACAGKVVPELRFVIPAVAFHEVEAVA